MVETAETAKKHPHYSSPLGGPNRGRGVASGFWFNIGLKSSASATVNADGTVSLVEGSTDIGGARTGVAMRLAGTKGAAGTDARPPVGETDTAGGTRSTRGRRATLAPRHAAYPATLPLPP